jgi:hypothetical protein
MTWRNGSFAYFVEDLTRASPRFEKTSGIGGLGPGEDWFLVEDESAMDDAVGLGGGDGLANIRDGSGKFAGQAWSGQRLLRRTKADHRKCNEGKGE